MHVVNEPPEGDLGTQITDTVVGMVCSGDIIEKLHYPRNHLQGEHDQDRCPESVKETGSSRDLFFQYKAFQRIIGPPISEPFPYPRQHSTS
jgi:hypothetical protein